MTQVKRYDSKLECDHRAMSYAVIEEENPDGEYVKYSDIQKVLIDLVIENAALKNSLDAHKDFIKTAVQNMGHILTPAAIQKLRELGFEQILKHPDAKSYFAFTENNPIWAEARKHRKDKSNYTLS